MSRVRLAVASSFALGTLACTDPLSGPRPSPPRTQTPSVAVSPTAAGDPHTTLDVKSYQERYFFASDLLSDVELLPFAQTTVVTLAVGIAESVQTGCANITWLGVNITDPNAEYDFTFPVKAAMSRSGELHIDPTFRLRVNNHILQNFVPSVAPCESGRRPFRTLYHARGSQGVYTAHIGSGVYAREVSEATYHMTRDFVVSNRSNVPIEQTVHVSGDMFASESFGNTDLTYGKAVMNLFGSIGVGSFSFKDSVVSTPGILPDDKGLNQTQRFVVAPGTGDYTIHVDVTAITRTEAQAKGGGAAGLLAGAATASVDFPGSFDVGNFSGPGGAPLPNGVRIVDATTGLVYADTRVFAGAPSVRTTAVISRDAGTGEVVVTATVRNMGPGEARNVRFTAATLNGRTTTTAMPTVVGRLIPELPAGAATRVFRFPTTTGASGTRAVLTVRGAYTGGTFGSDLRVTLP